MVFLTYWVGVDFSVSDVGKAVLDIWCSESIVPSYLYLRSRLFKGDGYHPLLPSSVYMCPISAALRCGSPCFWTRAIPFALLLPILTKFLTRCACLEAREPSSAWLFVFYIVSMPDLWICYCIWNLLGVALSLKDRIPECSGQVLPLSQM